MFGLGGLAAGEVIEAGGGVLEIVPDGVPLVVRARVDPADVDQVRRGQPARLRFSAFSQRTTPQFGGTVERVSADVVTDPLGGAAWFEAEIAIGEALGAAFEGSGVALQPGMPVEAYIETGERLVFSWLLKPLSDYFARALREE